MKFIASRYYYLRMAKSVVYIGFLSGLVSVILLEVSS